MDNNNLNSRHSNDYVYQGEIKKEKTQSLQEKTGASAEEIRKAIELLGFDRAKVEEYLIKRKL